MRAESDAERLRRFRQELVERLNSTWLEEVKAARKPLRKNFEEERPSTAKEESRVADPSPDSGV